MAPRLRATLRVFAHAWLGMADRNPLVDGASAHMLMAMEAARTTEAIQGCLDELAGPRGNSLAEPVVRGLLGRAAGRLHQLRAAFPYRIRPSLTRAPVNPESEELVSAVVERLIKALRE